MKKLTGLLVLLFCGGVMCADLPDSKLGKDLTQIVAEARQKAKLRGQEDEKNYSQAEITACEELYQTWPKQSGKRNENMNERRTIAQNLLKRFPKSNRAGCIQLYLAQACTGREEINLYRQVIKNYSDCYYYDGVQVGAFARYRLGVALLAGGKKSEAERWFTELKVLYPEAIDHTGKLLSDRLSK